MEVCHFVIKKKSLDGFIATVSLINNHMWRLDPGQSAAFKKKFQHSELRETGQREEGSENFVK